MGYFHNPTIVRDGLVLYLDAANKRSYSGSGTQWKDLSGSSNFISNLTNGAEYNSSNFGNIKFDGSNDYSTTSSSLNTGQNITVSVWMYASILGTIRRGLVANSYNYSGRNGWFLCTAGGSTNNTFFFSVGQDVAVRVAAANTLAINTWYNLTATCVNGGEMILLYRNGEPIQSYAGSTLSAGTITYTRPQFNIGYRDIGGTTDPFTGNISNVMIYTKALSPDEVRQNYEATKGRFGL